MATKRPTRQAKRAATRATKPSPNGTTERRVLNINDLQAGTLANLQQQIQVLQGRLSVYAEAIMAGHGITGRAALVEIKDGKQKKLIIDLAQQGK